MIWLLGGYMWLYVHRPFEVWPWLGVVQLERGYMLFMLLVWLVSPGKRALPNRVHLTLTVFTLVLASAWILSPYSGSPGCLDVVENYAKVMVFYVLVVTSVRDEKNLRRLVFLFLASVGLYMAHSLWEFLHGRIQWRMGISRMIGVDITFSDPNAFASTLLYSLPFLVPFWHERPRRIPRLFLLGYLVCAVGCILRTGSRAGFVGLIVLGLILFVWSAKRKMQAMGMAIVLSGIAFVTLSVLLPDQLQNRFLTLVDPSRGPQNAQESAEGRVAGFVHGIDVWQRSPLFGHGPGAFQYVTGRAGQAHNLYGQVLSEMGLAGALALSVLLLSFWWNWRETQQRTASWADWRTSDFTYQVSRAVAINVLLLLVMGWAGHNLFRYNWQWFAAFGVVALHTLRVRVDSREQAALYALPYLIIPHARSPYQHQNET